MGGLNNTVPGSRWHDYRQGYKVTKLISIIKVISYYITARHDYPQQRAQREGAPTSANEKSHDPGHMTLIIKHASPYISW